MTDVALGTRGAAFAFSLASALIEMPLQPMREVHKKHDGESGVLAQFGDSITHSLAFWAPLQWAADNLSNEGQSDYDLIKAHQKKECYRWKGPDRGNQGRMTACWAAENVDDWLKSMNPEVAVLIFGTNDINSVPLDEHIEKMPQVIRKCLENGTVVMLTTIPPRHQRVEESARFAEAQRQLAAELHVPLIDYHAAILQRRPGDWNGAKDAFRDYHGYKLPTLISRDGIHPSNPRQWANDHSEEGLNHNGFTLRNNITMMVYANVICHVIQGEPPPAAGDDNPANPNQARDKLNDGNLSQAASRTPMQPWFPQAPPLPPPSGEVIEVHDVDGLFQAAEDVHPGGTILLAEGIYRMPRYFQIHTDNVTLRGAGGNRERVVLDGSESRHGDLLAITAANGVTIADLTIQNVAQNGFKLNNDSGVHSATIRNCVIRNVWQRGLKGVPGGDDRWSTPTNSSPTPDWRRR